jgi:hypothetical protein
MCVFTDVLPFLMRVLQPSGGPGFVAKIRVGFSWFRGLILHISGRIITIHQSETTDMDESPYYDNSLKYIQLCEFPTQIWK